MFNKSVLLTVALAVIRVNAKLSKPALSDDLDYLLAGNTNNLAQNGGASFQKWEAGQIPEDCKSIAEGENLQATDFEVYNVFYDDCQDPWGFCRHKDSSDDVQTFVNTFGRVPVRMRSWVRHILTLPGANSAFNSNGNIALFGTTSSNLDVLLHETGHSLDLLGAYGSGALSSSQEWEDAYSKDSAVPDNYAQTNQVENVAQNTVVGIYDKVVPGGFPSAQPDYQRILNQYTLLQNKAGEQILPGGTCDRHLQNSNTVPMDGSSSKRDTKIVKAREAAHDSAFKGTYSKVVTDFTPFNSKDFHGEH